MGRTQTRLALLISLIEIPDGAHTADSEPAPPDLEKEIKVSILPCRHQIGSTAVSPLRPPIFDRESGLKMMLTWFRTRRSNKLRTVILAR